MKYKPYKRRKDRRMTVWIAVYSILMLSIMCISMVVVWRRSATKPSAPLETTKSTSEYVYVYVDRSESEEITEEAYFWYVREYEEKIGIFSHEGVLLEILDVYTHTLPKADQSMLREGITVYTREDLYSLIEDYTE